MNWSEILIPNHQLVERNLGDEIIVMDQDGHLIHSFVDSAYLIWQWIRSGITPEIMILDLMKKYEVNEEELRKDFMNFIEELKEKKILT